MGLVSGTLLLMGWRAFWFLTDDAYIAFRYAHNAVHGLGLVWNPPPFAPVEGYTSFLWIALLSLAWIVTGLEPPVVANVLALAFGLVTFGMTLVWLFRVALPAALEPARPLLAGLALLGVVTNRTFLAWLSSGLETAMWNAWVLLWLLVISRRPPRTPAWTLALSTVTALLALTRPDGLLYVSATLGFLALARPECSFRRALPSLAPLAVVPLHLLWRHAKYGAWLPNTYFAKHVAAWPESGLRYLASFVLEYGVWVWLLLLALAVWRHGRAQGLKAWTSSWRDHAGLVVGVATLTAHVAYYTLLVGGDHFEYRVYSHLVPVLFVSAVWLAGRAFAAPAPAALAVALFVLASWPIPWVHWDQTHDLEGRDRTSDLIAPIAQRFPGLLAPVVSRWDDWQAWLIGHGVCMRHQEHREFHRAQLDRWPTRAEGSRISWAQRSVLAWDTVGVPGWVFPQVAILDLYGLNDRVVARGPLRDEAGGRRMAHDRKPPPGYARCFRPNVVVSARGDLRIAPREPAERTDERIRSCEARYWNAMQ